MASSIGSVILFCYFLATLPLVLYFAIRNKLVLIEWSISDQSSSFLPIIIIFDWVSLGFRNLVCLISGCVMLYSSSYMSLDVFLKRFVWLVILFVLSMNFLVFIPRLPAIFLGWDGLGITSFALVIYYQNNKSLGAGMVTLLINRIGDVLILVAVALFLLQGHWNILYIWSSEYCWAGVLAVLVASMTKRAQIPFSRWLPAAIAAPTPVSALVHSSTLVTAGVFVLIRFFPFFRLFREFRNFLLFISTLTLLMAGICANCENDLKKIIALSTLSQLGVIILSLALGSPYLALFHLFTHALFKALLFLCAGIIIHRRSNWQDVRYMGMIRVQLPLTTTSMNIANLSLCGAPFLSGFYSKDIILEMSMCRRTRAIILFFIFLATGMTAAYSARLSLCCIWSPIKNVAYHSKIEKDYYVNVPICILTSLRVVIGFGYQNAFLLFKPTPFILSGGIKSLIRITLIVGIIASLIIWVNQFFAKKSNIGYEFFFYMWFLSMISRQPVTKFIMTLGSRIVKVVDGGWIEVIGGQGVHQVSSSLSVRNQLVQVKIFNFLVTLVVFFILFISALLFIV